MKILKFNSIDNDNMMNITDETKSFCIGLSLTVDENTEDVLYNFFEKELKINIINNEEYHDFNFDEGSGLEASIVIDTRNYEAHYLLDVRFETLEEANEYIAEKIITSKYVNKEFFKEISFLDAEKVSILLFFSKKEHDKSLELKKDLKKALDLKIEELKREHDGNIEALNIIKKIHISF